MLRVIVPSVMVMLLFWVSLVLLLCCVSLFWMSRRYFYAGFSYAEFRGVSVMLNAIILSIIMMGFHDTEYHGNTLILSIIMMSVMTLLLFCVSWAFLLCWMSCR